VLEVINLQLLISASNPVPLSILTDATQSGREPSRLMPEA
jgi:hypothetical protein